MREFESPGKLGLQKQKKAAWLRSFKMDRSGAVVTIEIEADGLEGQKPVLNFSNSRLKLGYLQEKEGKIKGVVSHEFILPNLNNAFLSDYDTKGNTIWVTLLNQEAKKRENTPRMRLEHWPKRRQAINVFID
jgi:hypothetical protein